MPIDKEIVSQFVKNVKAGDCETVEATLQSLTQQEARELTNVQYEEEHRSRTPLLTAMLNNNSALVKLLLEYAADPNRVHGDKSILGYICTDGMGSALKEERLSSENRPVNNAIIRQVLPRITKFHERISTGMGSHDMYDLFLTSIPREAFPSWQKFPILATPGMQTRPIDATVHYFKEIGLYILIECLLRDETATLATAKDFFKQVEDNPEIVQNYLDKYLSDRGNTTGINFLELANLERNIESLIEACPSVEPKKMLNIVEQARKYMSETVPINPRNYPTVLKEYQPTTDSLPRSFSELVGHLEFCLGLKPLHQEHWNRETLTDENSRGTQYNEQERFTEYRISVLPPVNSTAELKPAIDKCNETLGFSNFILAYDQQAGRHYFAGQDRYTRTMKGYIDEIPLIGLSQLLSSCPKDEYPNAETLKKTILADLFSPELVLVQLFSEDNSQNTLKKVAISPYPDDLILTLCEIITRHDEEGFNHLKNASIKNRMIKLLDDYEKVDLETFALAAENEDLKHQVRDNKEALMRMEKTLGQTNNEVQDLRSEVQALRVLVEKLALKIDSLEKSEQKPETPERHSAWTPGMH